MSTRRKSKKRNVSTSKTREFNGSVIAVGSSTGKVLINSTDSSKIMDGIKAIVSGKKSQSVSISLSKETAEAVMAVARSN